MNIIFLISNYMPHQLVSIKAVLKTEGVKVHAFSFKEPHDYQGNIVNLKSYKLHDFNREAVLNKIQSINPNLMVVAGWGIKDFTWVSKKIKSQFNIPIVAYSDTQWRSTWKQKINCLVSPLHLRKAFTHLWVAGIYQYEYARKLGFGKTKIIYNSLSCDMELFGRIPLERKLDDYPKNILYIGRFVDVKGLDLLIDAWDLIKDKKGWTLTLIGNGELKEQLSEKKNIIIKDFMSQKLLVKEIERAGCFVLPSVFEPWALVIHEAAAAGLPIIATDICGATPHLLINNFNGYRVKPNSSSIREGLEKIMLKNKSELIEMSRNSKRLAESITPELGSAQLLSILNDYDDH